MGQLDTTPDLWPRPEKRVVKEYQRYEDVDDPVRPRAPPRPRQGLWAPPSPELVDPPQLLVVGIGRQLREMPERGPRARLGAGAVEELQRRYGVRSYFDVDTRGYFASCRSSLDKSGKAGIQKVNLLQPVAEYGGDVGHSMWRTMKKPGMDEAMILFVLSDHRLPFGQLRMRANFDSEDPRLRSAYRAISPDNRVTTLHVGAGRDSPARELQPGEEHFLPHVLHNAASAIEVWLSEADLGLVMRFVNRPQVYEMPVGWPHKALPVPARAVAEASSSSDGSSETCTQEKPCMQSLMHVPDQKGRPTFALFDLHRDEDSKVPELAVLKLEPQAAMEAVGERPPGIANCGGALRIGLRRFESIQSLQKDVKELLVEHPAGRHLRLKDDEDIVRALLTFHPDGDRLLDDTVEVKVDSSPIDDGTRCFWVVKFDGYEEDISIKTCLKGFEDYLLLAGVEDAPAQVRRLAPGRWSRGLRETTYDRAKNDEQMARFADDSREARKKRQPAWEQSMPEVAMDPRKIPGKRKNFAPKMPWQ